MAMAVPFTVSILTPTTAQPFIPVIILTTATGIPMTAIITGIGIIGKDGAGITSVIGIDERNPRSPPPKTQSTPAGWHRPGARKAPHSVEHLLHNMHIQKPPKFPSHLL